MAKSAEQQARDLLERLDVEDAQSFSSGDLVELANLIAEVERLRVVVKEVRHQASDFTPSPDLADAILAILDRYQT